MKFTDAETDTAVEAVCLSEYGVPSVALGTYARARRMVVTALNAIPERGSDPELVKIREAVDALAHRFDEVELARKERG